MTEAEARAEIERLTAHDYDPKLETTDIDTLVAIAATDDPEVWNTKRGIASGWETKAARAAGDFRFEEDNQSFYREQVYRACKEMAKRYSRDLVQVPLTTDMVVA